MRAHRPSLLPRRRRNMHIKPGVKLWAGGIGLHERLLWALHILEGLWGPNRLLTVTSALDGKHMKRSLHYKGLAVDVRTNDIPSLEKVRLVESAAAVLGTNFDVVLEDWGGTNEHLHVEFDPEGPWTTS